MANIHTKLSAFSFDQSSCELGKKNNHTFGQLLDSASGLLLILGDPQDQTSPPEQGLLTSDDPWSFSSALSHSWLSGFLNTSLGYFPSSRRHNQKRQAQQQAESQYWFSELQSEGCCGRKGQVEATVSTQENSEQTQYCIPEASQRLVPPSRTGKMKCDDSHQIPFSS